MTAKRLIVAEWPKRDALAGLIHDECIEAVQQWHQHGAALMSDCLIRRPEHVSVRDVH
ncbi:hypothetical protein ACI2J9_02510 [Pseudomonas fulva]|uniref:hypothetical protein n=1 Tax=Pseudomonas fulva TaxID=47880 RepID=UPI0038514EAC